MCAILQAFARHCKESDITTALTIGGLSCRGNIEVPCPPLSFVGEQGLTVGDGIHYGLGDWGKSGEAYRIMRLYL